jgi:hypothetical protein
MPAINPTTITNAYAALVARDWAAPPTVTDAAGCVYGKTGMAVLKQGTTMHQFALVAIGIGAGIVVTLLAVFIGPKISFGKSGGGGGAAAGGAQG